MPEYPTYVTTQTERIFWDRMQRDEEVIRAMQRRAARNPVRDLLWRRPWRAPHGPGRNPRNWWGWLSNAHDCADPAVGCSCSGGFRFPYRGGTDTAT